MIPAGQRITCQDGRRVRVDSFAAAGGQGVIYRTTEEGTRRPGALKVFTQPSVETLRRLQYLVSQDLRAACPVLWPPVAIVQTPQLGHYAPWAEGKELEELLLAPDFDFAQGLQLALAVAVAVDALHQRGIAHGDLRSANVKVHSVGSVRHAALLDLDNFAAAGVPPPPAFGHELYMAPELRLALRAGRLAVPTLQSDRFALAGLIHEILLLRHVAARHDGDAEAFHAAMCSGRWLEDPMLVGRAEQSLGGYAAGVLNADLQRLLRLAMSLDPCVRPSARAWKDALLAAVDLVHPCPLCAAPCLVEAARTTCATCRGTFPHLSLRLHGTGRMIELRAGATVLGRSEFGGSPRVSARHAVFHRMGPETWMDATGTNGTFRWNGSAWQGLPRNTLIRAGDWLQLADVRVEVLANR